MKVTLAQDDNGVDILRIEVPLTESKQSRSGNSTVMATTRGQQFIGNIKGKPTYLQLNVMQMGEAGGGLQVEESPNTSTRRRAA